MIKITMTAENQENGAWAEVQAAVDPKRMQDIGNERALREIMNQQINKMINGLTPMWIKGKPKKMGGNL